MTAVIEQTHVTPLQHLLSQPSLCQEDCIDLRSELAKMQQVFQEMPAGVVIIDGLGVVRQANRAALSLLGEPLEGIRWRSIIERSFQPRDDDGHEVSLKDGRRVKISISPLAGEPGQLIMLTDLTETRLLQERVGHMQRLSALGKMVASLAHQIRTPLSAAMLYGANLSNKTISASARSRFSEKLMSRLRDLEHQVNDMLLFAKSGGQQVIDELSLQSLLTEVQAGAEAMVSQNGGVLTVDLPEPDILIYGNKIALASAVQNLIHNALEVKKDKPKISLAAYRDENDAKQVIISVKDNGPGISKTKQAHIFEPFYTTKSNGTGLGLAVVNSVAGSHHGHVSLNSELGKGACFNIHLPIYRTAESSAAVSHGS